MAKRIRVHDPRRHALLAACAGADQVAVTIASVAG